MLFYTNIFWRNIKYVAHATGREPGSHAGPVLGPGANVAPAAHDAGAALGPGTAVVSLDRIPAPADDGSRIPAPAYDDGSKCSRPSAGAIGPWEEWGKKLCFNLTMFLWLKMSLQKIMEFSNQGPTYKFVFFLVKNWLIHNTTTLPLSLLIENSILYFP